MRHSGDTSHVLGLHDRALIGLMTYTFARIWPKSIRAAMKRHPIAKILEKLFVNKH